MPNYRYRITVEALEAQKDSSAGQAPLVFEAENHDDIFRIVELLKTRKDLDFGAEGTAAFAVGLKLFAEVMMKHRDHPVFAPLRESFKAFMLGLKKGSGH